MKIRVHGSSPIQEQCPPSSAGISGLTDFLALLVAEDEALIRCAMEQTLESGGFDVVGASSGNSALQLLIDSATRFAGLITDIRLGDGIDGWALARKARELIPDLCVVYITGDSAADWPAKGVPGSMVLQKPFADALLLTGISTLLNERGRLP